MAPFLRLTSWRLAHALVAEAGDLARKLVLQCGHVRVDHDAHELLEGHSRLPAQSVASLARVAHQRIHLGGSEVAGIDLHVRLPVESRVAEGVLQEVAYAVALARGD